MSTLLLGLAAAQFVTGIRRTMEGQLLAGVALLWMAVVVGPVLVSVLG